MWTEEQFNEVREFLDLRKSEIREIQEALKSFPEKIEYPQLPWDLIKETWEMFEYNEYPICKIILDIWCENYLRDIIIDDLDEYSIYYDSNINCIELADVIEKPNASKDWKQKIEDKVNGKFLISIEYGIRYIL